MAVGLRSIRHDDVEWIFEACQDAEIQRWTLVPRPYLRQHAESFVQGEADEFRTWVIEVDDRPVGMTAVHEIEDGVASIGYWIAPWGRRVGAASGAVRTVVNELRSLGGVAAVTANIAEANEGSRRTVESCGFTVAGRIPRGCHDDGLAVDALQYRLAL